VLPNTLIAGADFAPPNDENRAKIFGGGHTAGMLGADAHPR
jgi:hypothetical protein